MRFNLPKISSPRTVIKAAATVTTGAAVLFGGFALNQRSLDTIAPTSPRIQAVTHCAASKPIAMPDGTKVTFVVYHGLRTDAEQRSMIARGVSWVNRSRHQDGKAIDVMAELNYTDPATNLIIKKSSWAPEPYYQISKAFYACSKELGIPITWGGEWRVKDLVHFEEKEK